MTQKQETGELMTDPEGSIFLFEPLTVREYSNEWLGLLMDRGKYRGMDVEEKNAEVRELKLRRALTDYAMTRTKLIDMR